MPISSRDAAGVDTAETRPTVDPASYDPVMDGEDSEAGAAPTVAAERPAAEVAPTEQAPAADATTGQPDTAEAWSDEGDTEPYGEPRRRSWLIPAAVFTLALAVAGAIVASIVEAHRHQAAQPAAPGPTSGPVTTTPPTPPAAALLSGTYRIDYDWENSTYRNNKKADGGTVHWDHDDMPPTIWWAFTSTCNGMDCTATGIALDSADHSRVSSSSGTDVMRFVNGVWVDVTPYRTTSTCTYTSDGAFAGTSHESRAWSFTPLANGTFRGEMVATVDGDGCGDDGNTLITPLTITRVGDVPPGVMVTTAP